MKNKYLIIIIIILSVVAIVSSPKKETTNFYNEEKPEEKEINLTIKDNKTNTESILNLEDYIVGVVAGEMPVSFHIEALKAQAIAARTYAVYKMGTSKTTYDLVTDVSNQVYITLDEMKEKWGDAFFKYYEKIKSAVASTDSLIMNYNGEVISSFYFAISNGKTEDVALVFGEAKDYLKSVDSSWDKDVKSFNKTTEFTKEDFCNKLVIKCENIKIEDIKRSDTGRVNTIKINDKTFKGTEIRNLLKLRSTDFTISIKDKIIIISTNGYGHGVGMSQYGANEMAKLGSSYKEILNHYYQNVNIEKINV